MNKTTVTINLAAIKYNYLYIKSLAPNTKTYAIIKTNAYGLGSINIANYLDKIVDGFGVAKLTEALELRNNGIQSDIVLLSGIFSPKELNLAICYNLILAITTDYQAKWLAEVKLNKELTVFLKYDSGMSRLGLSFNQCIEIYKELKINKKIKNIVLMSHFCCADEKNNPQNKIQMNNFNKLKQQLNINQTSLSNSAAILNQLYQENYKRLGIALYGINLTSMRHNLQTAVELTAPIIAIKTLAKNTSIGYGATYTTYKKIIIGVVAIGYGDGYPRNIKANTPVFVAGQQTIILGRVSMDMLTIDLSNICAKVGDSVELFGSNININTIANSAQTIAYEILCNLTRKITRNYLTKLACLKSLN